MSLNIPKRIQQQQIKKDLDNEFRNDLVSKKTKEIYCSKCGKNDFEHYEFWKWRERAIKKEVRVLCYTCCDYQYFVEKKDLKNKG